MIMRLTTRSCRLGGTISGRMKRWRLSGSTAGCVIGLPAFGLRCVESARDGRRNHRTVCRLPRQWNRGKTHFATACLTPPSREPTCLEQIGSAMSKGNLAHHHTCPAFCPRYKCYLIDFTNIFQNEGIPEIKGHSVCDKYYGCRRLALIVLQAKTFTNLFSLVLF